MTIFSPPFISKFFLSFLFHVQEDKDGGIKYFSLTSCLYCLTSVEGHGLRVSKNTVVEEFIDWGCVCFIFCFVLLFNLVNVFFYVSCV